MEIINYIKKYKYHIFVAFNLLWIWALLSPNIYYFDDNYRAAGGYYNWGGDFRPFADYLYYILGMGRNFTDLTPLPQLFALVFLYSIYFLYIKKFNAGKINIPILLVFLPIVWSPFLLANLYFRYDSIFMLLAVLLSVLAVFCVDKKQYIRAVVLLFVACGFYQPAIVSYICTTLFIVYTLQAESKNGLFQLWLKKSFIYFLVFLGGVATYYFTIMKFTTDYNFYSASHSQMEIYNLVPNITQVLQELSVIFKGDTGSIFLAIFIYLVLINLAFLVKKFSYLGILIFCIHIIVFLVAAAGVNLLLNVPRFEYRTLMFFGFFISYLLLGMTYLLTQDQYKKYVYFVLFFVGFYFLSITLNVSNAQKYKNKFDDALILDIVNTLYDSKKFNSNKTIVFYGETIPYTAQRLVDKYPIIAGVATNASYYTYKIQNFFPYQLKYIKFRLNKDKQEFMNHIKNQKDFLIIKDTRFYTIYDSQINTVIEFKSLEEGEVFK